MADSQSPSRFDEVLTDEQILSCACNAADAMDATRVHEMRNGAWHPLTTFDGDSGLLRFGRLIEQALIASRSEKRAPEITAKFLEECGYVRKGGARLTFQGGNNIAPTAVEYYNPETGHAAVEFVGVQPVLLEKGKEAQYVKRWLYWAALTSEKK